VDPSQQFAHNLRRLRRAAGLSQEQLGFEAQIHRTEIGFLERGDRDPQLKTLVRLARGLDVSLADLLDEIR
jgi:transcriptional regulator with XRE-family HTH domain